MPDVPVSLSDLPDAISAVPIAIRQKHGPLKQEKR